MARRAPGAGVIVPSVVHWNVGHFAAIVREQDGMFLVQDSTFGNETWLRREALDVEASGYFLVPEGTLPQGWTKATAGEGAALFGKGHSGNIDDVATGDDDRKDGGGCGGSGAAMASYQFHTMATSLHIEDTPVGYAPAVGPEVRVRVAYNQREAGQPSAMDFTNFGPQFVSNWVSYLIDNPGSPSANVTLRKRGGGSEVHSGYNAGTQTFAREHKTASVLTRLTANTYRKSYPDGRQEYYEQNIGTAPGPRKVFLSRIIDAQGNEVALQYDTTYSSRIQSIVDATGLPTTFHYDHPGAPYLVTSVQDPYGREATFAYGTVGSATRLQSIEDTYGIVSAFTYGGAGEVVEMTTPYGTTKFKLSPLFLGTGGYAMIRYVEATDPLGQTERLEYNTSSVETGTSPTLEQPYPSSTIVKHELGDNDDRNSFYWDKLRMKLAPGNYQRAHRYHWIQPDGSDTATGILESELPPLEGRIFYNYPGQTTAYIRGTLASPSVVARVVKDAQGNNQTQATKREYNAQGNVTKTTDPVGRETLTEYAANGIDVVAVKQKIGVSGGQPVWTTISTMAYAPGTPAHRPSSVTDGAGQTTSYTYAPNGQVLTIQNAKGEITTFGYETNTASAAHGRLVSISGAVPGGDRTFTYDDYGRVRTTTDSEGYALTYDYDALDRIRTVTFPDGSFEQSEYEDQSLVATRDREGRWTRHMYNGLQERVVTQDPALRMTQQQWCRCGKLRRFVDGNGNITEWIRDERGRPTRKVQADGTFEAYAYDFSGRLLTEMDAMNRTTSYQYTVDDRIAKKDYSDPGTPDVTYAYDPYFPRTTSRIDGAGTTTFAYHPYGTNTLGAGQLSLENGPLANDTIKRTYDELGRMKKLQIVDDATQTVASYTEESTFDTRGRVTAVQNNLGTSAYAFVGQSGRPSVVNYPNGMQIQYDYFGGTGDFLLKQIKNLSAGPNPTVISQFDYTYRQDRTINTWTIEQDSGATVWTFDYDDARQLTSATHLDAAHAVLELNSYGYDPAGSRTHVGSASGAPRNYATNSLNQLVSERGFGSTTFRGILDEPATVTVNGRLARVTSNDGGAPFNFEAVVDLDAGINAVTVEAKDGRNNSSTKTYTVEAAATTKRYECDANGNLRIDRLANATVEREYRWDQQNRLSRVLKGTNETAYEYDGDSRRVRIRQLTGGVETKVEMFVWCGTRICQKRTATGVVRNYFKEGFAEGASDYAYTRDHLGSVREVVASDGATVESWMSYDPWGKTTEHGAGALTDFGFTGHHFDRSTGLALTLFRAYDSNVGRWLSKDPIGLDGGLNLYAYVDNNPVNLVDTFGLSPCDPSCIEMLTPIFGALIARTLCSGKVEPAKDKWSCSSSCNVEGT